MGIFAIIKQVYSIATRIIFPQICVFCGDLIGPNWECRNICETCASKILWIPEDQALNTICSQKFELWSIGFAKQLFGTGKSCFKHSGIGRSLILALKYGNSEFLAKDIVHLVEKNRPDVLDFIANSILVPVPLSYRKRVIRGYNQASSIAYEFAKHVNGSSVDELLWAKYHRSQTSINAEERLANTKNTFFARKSKKNYNKRIVVVDDVMTTGATLAACCEALFDQGFIDVNVLTLSHS